MIHSSRTLQLSLACACVLSLSAFAQAPAPAPTTPAAAPATPAPAATAPTTTAPANDPAVVGDRNKQLSDRIPPEQQLQLQAGDDAFPARYIADLAPDHRGAVIVLHDSGQHRSWPFTVAALLDELPQFGWSTLAIEVPPAAQDAPGSVPVSATPGTPAAAPPPAAGAAAVVAANTSLVTGSEDGAEKQAQARIDAAVKKLLELNGGKSQPVVLVGFGSGAWRIAEFARKLAEGNGARSTTPLAALVLVDPRNRLAATKVDLPILLPMTELAALDIVQSSEPRVRADAEARRRAVLKQRDRIYQQLALPPLANGDAIAQTALTRRIRGWMQLHATETASGNGRPNTAPPPNP